MPGPDFWNDRFSQDAYVYGVAPNAFVASVEAEVIPPESEVLDLGAGEGRNAVFLARRGHRVTAVDASTEGLRKTRALAAEHDVSLDTRVVDVTAWTPDRTWDAVVTTFLHLDATAQPALYRTIRAALRPGGVLVAEWFRPEQRTDGYASGGPPDPDWMVTPDELRRHFAADGIRQLDAATPVLDEGPHHQGPAATVRFVWQKPSG